MTVSHQHAIPTASRPNRQTVSNHPRHVTILDNAGHQIDAGTITAHTATGIVIESDRDTAHQRHTVDVYDFEPGRTFRFDY